MVIDPVLEVAEKCSDASLKKARGRQGDFWIEKDMLLWSGQIAKLYSNFTASVGISVFVPKMKPRIYDF